MFRVSFLIKIDERTGNAVSPSGEGQCLKKRSEFNKDGTACLNAWQISLEGPINIDYISQIIVYHGRVHRITQPLNFRHLL